MNYEQTNKRSRRHRSDFSVILTIIIIAAVMVGGVVAGIYFSGIRYIKMNTEDDGTVKFFGKVDAESNPLTGQLKRGVLLGRAEGVFIDRIHHDNLQKKVRFCANYNITAEQSQYPIYKIPLHLRPNCTIMKADIPINIG